MIRREFLSRAATVGMTALIAPATVVAFSGEQADELAQWYERSRPLMGSYVSVAVYLNERERAQQIIDGCFRFLERKISRLTEWEASGDIYALNNGASINEVKLASVVQRFLTIGEQVCRDTRGVVNINCLALTKLWREAKQAVTIPSLLEIAEARHRMLGASVKREHGMVRLVGESGIDTGAIGQGLLAEMATEFLQASGVRYGRVDCSGDLRFLGDTNWGVEIVNPSEGAPIGVLQLRGDIAVSTSGDYNNYFEVGGERYHHLIDLQTGTPGRMNRQVTIVHPNGAVADALATATFFMEARYAIKFLRGIPGALGVIVDRHNEIAISQGLVIERS